MSGKGRRSKSTKDVLKGVKKVGKFMGALNSSNHKSLGHVELSSNSESELDELGNSHSSSCMREQGYSGERRDSQKENVVQNNSLPVGERSSGKLQRAESVEKEKGNVASPSAFPPSPTSVIPILDAPGKEHTAPAKGISSVLRKAKSARTLMVEDERHAVTGRQRETKRSKSVRSLKINSDDEASSPKIRKERQALKKTPPSNLLNMQSDEANKEESSSREAASGSSLHTGMSLRNLNTGSLELKKDKSSSPTDRKNRWLKQTGSSKSLHLSLRNLRIGSDHLEESPSSEVRNDRRIKRTGSLHASLKKVNLGFDGMTKDESSSSKKQGGQQTVNTGRVRRSKSSRSLMKKTDGKEALCQNKRLVRRHRSLRHINVVEDDFKACNAKETVQEKVVRRSGSMRNLNVTEADLGYKENSASSSRQQKRVHSIRKSKSFDKTLPRGEASRSTTRRKGSIRTVRSFEMNSNKDGRKEAGASIRYNERRRSMTMQSGQELSRVTCGGTNTVGNDDSDQDSNRNLCRSMSLTRLTDQKWQRRRSKSRSRGIARRAKSRSKSNRRTSLCHSVNPSSANLNLEKADMQRAPGKSKPPVSRRASVSNCFSSSDCDWELGAAQQKAVTEGDKEPVVKLRRQRSGSSSRLAEDGAGSRRSEGGASPRGSITDVDAGAQTDGSTGTRGRQRPKKTGKKRTDSLKGLKDLRTKLGHSSGNLLSPRGCNQSITPSVTSGSISSLTMSSRLFSHDDHSLASSQRSPFRRAYSMSKLFVAGELSSSALLEGDEEPENKGSRWESLPQNKGQNSMDALPVAPNHDVSSLADLLDGQRSASEAGRWSTSKGGSNGKSTEADKPPAHPIQAPDTPSVQSNMGLISELTPGTFIEGAGGSSFVSPMQKKLGGAEKKSAKSFNSWMESLSNLMLEDTVPSPRETQPNQKKDSIPRMVRRHSFDSVTSFSSGAGRNSSGQKTAKSGASVALTQNARKPARQTSSHSRCAIPSTASIAEET